MPNLIPNQPFFAGKEKLSRSGGWRILTFMIFVFAVALASYAGLKIGYENFLEAQIAERDEELAALAGEVSKDEQEAFLNFEYQIINLQGLLNNHKIFSKLFNLLETNTHSEVYYESLSADVAKRTVTLQVVASSYEVLAQQLAAYEKMPEVASYKLESMRLSEKGAVKANINLVVAHEVFRS